MYVLNLKSTCCCATTACVAHGSRTVAAWPYSLEWVAFDGDTAYEHDRGFIFAVTCVQPWETADSSLNGDSKTMVKPPVFTVSAARVIETFLFFNLVSYFVVLPVCYRSHKNS